MAEPILYSFRRCPYAMRARLALAAGGIGYELREVRLSDKPAEMLEISPKGTVPVMQAPDGTVIEQSLDIMRWALAHRDPQGWLLRDDPALIARNDGAFKHHLDGYKYPERHGGDPASHRDEALGFLRDLDTRIAAAGYLCGAAPGLADAAIMPFVRQFAAVDRHWFADQPLAQLQAWLAGFLASDLFLGVMRRVDPWKPGDQPTVVAGPLVT